MTVMRANMLFSFLLVHFISKHFVNCFNISDNITRKNNEFCHKYDFKNTFYNLDVDNTKDCVSKIDDKPVKIKCYFMILNKSKLSSRARKRRFHDRLISRIIRNNYGSLKKILNEALNNENLYKATLKQEYFSKLNNEVLNKTLNNHNTDNDNSRRKNIDGLNIFRNNSNFKVNTTNNLAENISGESNNFLVNKDYLSNDQKTNRILTRFFDSVVFRIVGGETTDIKQFPYAVTLLYKGQQICGGSVITVKHILTAAHCIMRRKNDKQVSLKLENLIVRAGSTHAEYGGVTRRVADAFTHPKYTGVFIYDVAVILLNESLVESESIRIVTIPTDCNAGDLVRMTEEGDTCWVTGWGDTIPDFGTVLSPWTTSEQQNNRLRARYFKIQYATMLKALKVKLITWTACKQAQPYIHEESMVCTGHEDVSGPCQRDSGSPMVCDGVQYGIVSWGVGCGRRDQPDIYSRVDTSYDFIMKTITKKSRNPRACERTARTEPFLNSLVCIFLVYSIK